ncbi:MAG: GNAT family N-acetyltransferase [Candidatus Nanopelagicales bacterium]
MDPNAGLVDAMRNSLYRLTGRDLAYGLDLSQGLETAVWFAPYVLVAHDRSADPVFVYGNSTALSLFEMDWPTFTSLPSRLSAEPDEQVERERLLQGVAERGFISDYRGVRVSSTGRRFVIEDAVVWDVVDDEGRVRGQAALFERWSRLDVPEPQVDHVPDPGHHTDDWSGRHDLGWSDSPADTATADALAATVAAAETLPHHDVHPAYETVDAAATEAPWTSAYDVVEPAVGEHAHHYEAHTVVAVDDPLVADGIRVVEDRVAVVDDPVTGALSRERVRTFLTLGADSDLAVGYDVDAPPEVRPLTRDELDVVLGWAADAGWNPGLHDADTLWAADPDALWGVEIDGVLVGSGATVRRGSRAGGVGLLLVDPAHRRRGIGTLTFPFLVDGALSRLESGASLALECPEIHQDFCERFGFVPVRKIATSTSTAVAGRRGPYAGQLRALAQLPFEKIVDYDARFSGGERPDFLRACMTPRGGLGLGAYEAGRLLGMAILRPARDGHRIGPFYAESTDVAEELYNAVAGTVVGQKLVLDVPLEDPDVVAFASARGFGVVSEVVHMELGTVHSVQREQVYGEGFLQYG